MNPAAIALTISVAANVALGWAYLDSRDDVGVGKVKFENAAGAATACSDATEDLRTLADKRKQDATSARAAAATKAMDHNKRADYTLGLQPKNPANSCASIQALGDEWLANRMLPK